MVWQVAQKVGIDLVKIQLQAGFCKALNGFFIPLGSCDIGQGDVIVAGNMRLFTVLGEHSSIHLSLSGGGIWISKLCLPVF